MCRIIWLYMLCLVIFGALNVYGESVADKSNQTEGYSAKMVWQTDAVFQTPESVVYDAKRDVLYVSNHRRTDAKPGGEFISRVDTDGKVLEPEWVKGLNRPTGLTIYQDKLYAVERTGLVRIDIETGRIEKRYPITGADFPNDIIFDSSGVGYISNNGRSGKTSVFRFKDDGIEPWLSTEEVLQPNGLLIEGEYLAAYDNRRKALVRIDRVSRKIQEIAKIDTQAAAMGDGLVKPDAGTYLITAWGGPSWIVEQDGKVTDFINTEDLKKDGDKEVNNADVGLVSQENLLIIPTFFGNRLLAYELSKGDRCGASETGKQ
ncbi:hypothetical protein JW935_06205 [candidate division KSB1 bacterium]|nr:hypothetical protein [candidate division KSB1 bacterium]